VRLTRLTARPLSDAAGAPPDGTAPGRGRGWPHPTLVGTVVRGACEAAGRTWRIIAECPERRVLGWGRRLAGVCASARASVNWVDKTVWNTSP
jgi:hypothetical protein